MSRAKNQPPPLIFDEPLRHRNLCRATKNFADYNFLHRQLIEDIIDRLESVTRSFPNSLISGPGAHLLRPALTEKSGVEQLTELLPFDISKAHSANRLEAETGLHPLFQAAENSCDLVISIMSLHMVNDLPGALLAARRCLKPDGLFIAALPGENTLQELRTCLYEAESEIIGGVSPRIIPFAMIKDLGGLLQRAGFALPVADKLSLPVTYREPIRLLRDLRGMGETNCLFSRKKTTLRRDILTRAMQLYQERFSVPLDDQSTGVCATFEMVLLTGWAPHESQQKPLQPGSAKHSMAEAVKNYTAAQDENSD